MNIPRFRVFHKKRKVWLDGSFCGSIGDFLINSEGNVFVYNNTNHLFVDITEDVELYEHNDREGCYESKPDAYGKIGKVMINISPSKSEKIRKELNKQTVK